MSEISKEADIMILEVLYENRFPPPDGMRSLNDLKEYIAELEKYSDILVEINILWNTAPIEDFSDFMAQITEAKEDE